MNSSFISYLKEDNKKSEIVKKYKLLLNVFNYAFSCYFFNYLDGRNIFEQNIKNNIEIRNDLTTNSSVVITIQSFTNKNKVTFLFADDIDGVDKANYDKYDYIFITDTGLFHTNNILNLNTIEFNLQNINKNINDKNLILLNTILNSTNNINHDDVFMFFKNLNFYDISEKNSVIFDVFKYSYDNELRLLRNIISKILISNTPPEDKKQTHVRKYKHSAELVRYYFPFENEDLIYEFLYNTFKNIDESIETTLNDIGSNNIKNDETNNVIKNVLIFILKNGINLRFLKDSKFNIYNRADNTSGQYKSLPFKYKFMSNGKTIQFFIVNTNLLGEKTIKNKDLVPNNILKNLDNITLNDVKDIQKNTQDVLTSKINKTNSNEIKTAIEVTDILLNKCVIDDSINETNGIFKNKKIDLEELDNKKDIGSISYNTLELFDVLNNEKSKFNFNDIIVILNDYGEILGSLIFLKQFSNIKRVIFPSAANESLIDYKLELDNGDVLLVSAKAQGGSAPSGSTVFNFLAENIDTYTKLDKLDKYLDDETKQIINENPDYVKNFITSMHNIYEKKSYDYVKNMVFMYLDDLKNTDLSTDEIKVINNIYKLLQADDLNQFIKKNFITSSARLKQFNIIYKQIIRPIYLLFGSKDIKNEIYLYDNGDFKNSKLADFMPHKKNYDKGLIDPRKLFGLCIYPVYNKAVMHLNDKYDKILTALIQAAFSDMLQVYISAKRNLKLLKFEIFKASEMKWKFILGSVSRNIIFGKKVSIKMEK